MEQLLPWVKDLGGWGAFAIVVWFQGRELVREIRALNKNLVMAHAQNEERSKTVQDTHDALLAQQQILIEKQKETIRELKELKGAG